MLLSEKNDALANIAEKNENALKELKKLYKKILKA